MSDYYRVSIQEISDCQVVAAIQIVHPDIGSDFESPDFAVQILLLMTKYAINSVYLNTVYSQANQVAPEPAPACRQVYEHLYRYLYDSKVEISPEEWKTYRASEAAAKQLREKYGYGRWAFSDYRQPDGRCYLSFEADRESFANISQLIVKGRVRKARARNAAGKPIKNHYTLTFEVHDPAYLHHLRVGMTFETAFIRLRSY